MRNAAEGGAPYRDAARRLYKAMLTESCKPNPELRRALVLAREIAEVHAYETRVATPARTQLAIARNDLEGNLGCWADDDAAFAEIHVKMARDGVRDGLGELSRLASGLVAVPVTNIDPVKAAAFRALVRELSDRIEPLCFSGGGEPVLAYARGEFDRLRKDLAPTAWAVHFALAEADAKLVRDQTTVECAEPGPANEAPAVERDMKELNARIATTAGL